MTTKNEKQSVEMTAEELAQFNEFKANRQKKEEAEQAKADRDAYKKMVDETLDESIPCLLFISECIKDTKQSVLANFRSVIDMKTDVLKVTKDEQRTHTFTNTAGNKRITIGVYITDGYRDTVEEGITIVKECIESLAFDDKSKALVRMVMKLLARDATGTLKANRVVQLRKVAQDIKHERFMEGVQIIEEAYQPAISKQFIRAEMKNENGAWVSIPLGMTEA